MTNAGIHARPGRERIFSKHVAHVLNDESQRKYIQVKLECGFYCLSRVFNNFLTFQGLKRLMTKCQQYFITDPSRSVDFQRQETDPEPETGTGATVGVASLREVAFISSKEKEGEEEVTGDGDDKKEDS